MKKLILATAILVATTFGAMADSYRFGYETLITSRNGIAYYAQDEGLFKAAGVSVEVLTNSVGGRKNLALLSAGKIDFATADFSALIEHNNTFGNDLVAVYVYSDATEMSLLSKVSPSIIDYNGRAIATGKTSVARMVFPHVFPSVKFQPVYMGLNLRVPAMLSGQTDALLGFAGTQLFNIAYSQDIKDIHVIRYADYEPRYIGPSIIVRKTFLENNYEDVAKVVGVFDDVLKQSIANRELTIDAVIARNPRLTKDIELDRLNYVYDNFVVTANVEHHGLNSIDPSRIEFYASRLVPDSTLAPSDYYAKIDY